MLEKWSIYRRRTLSSHRVLGWKFPDHSKQIVGAIEAMNGMLSGRKEEYFWLVSPFPKKVE